MNGRLTMHSPNNPLAEYTDAMLEQNPGADRIESAQHRLMARLEPSGDRRRAFNPGWAWATATALALLLVPVLVWMPGQNGSLAFADIQRYFESFDTLQARMRTTLNGETILEMDVRTDAQNRTRLDAGDSFSYVIDPERAGMLQLFHQSRRAVFVPLDEPAGEADIEPLEWLYQIRDFQGLAESLDETIEIHGQTAHGFRLHTGGFSMTLWAAASGEPMRLEIRPEGDAPAQPETRLDFEFDRPLDESAFSLDPPAGYRLASDSDSAE